MYEETTLRLDRELCTDCGICMLVCPHEVFAQHNGNVTVADRSACMECGACQMNCPFEAVTVDSGVGCAAALMYQAVTKKKQPSCGS
jgi:NAD-dependent dihydropyrimidine dehydrogenase PreA subunit